MSQLEDPVKRKAAEAQVGNYVRILNANGVRAVPGDPTQFTDLFTGGEWVAGVVVGSGIASRQTYNMTVSDNGTADGLIGYRLDEWARVETMFGEVLKGMANPDPHAPFMMLPGPGGMPMPIFP